MAVSGAWIVGLARSQAHVFSKTPRERLTLVEGLGVAGDAHEGSTVQHLSRLKADPAQPNLRQVHIIHAELFDELAEKGFRLSCGDLGENMLTRGIPLLDLPEGTRLSVGGAVVRITGLRNPCKQIEAFMPGLLAQMIDRRPDGSLVRKCGVMGVVESGGEIAVGQGIEVTVPETPHRPLVPV